MGYRQLASIVWLTCLLLAACRNGEPVLPAAEFGVVSINTTAKLAAGDPLFVEVTLFGETGENPVTLVMVGSYGARLYQTVADSSVARFSIPAEDTQKSGLVTLTAALGETQASAELEIEPHKPVDPIQPLIGARTIVADGERWSMTVTIPADRFGNPIDEGTPVTFRARRPTGAIETDTMYTEHLLAWRRVYATTKAGRTFISLTSEDAFGPQGILDEVPGWPVPFDVFISDTNLPADGRQQVTLSTSVLVDQFGNEIPDGTVVTFIVEGASTGRRILTAFTLNGQAETFLEAPTEADIVSIHGTVYGVETAPVQLVFTPGPAVGTFAVVSEYDDVAESLEIVAGPILGQLNEFVPEATPVLFQFVDDSGNEFWLQDEASDGYSDIIVRLVEFDGATDWTVNAFAGAGSGLLQLDVSAYGTE